VVKEGNQLAAGNINIINVVGGVTPNFMNAVVGEASISVNTETRGEYLLVIVKGEANTITRS